MAAQSSAAIAASFATVFMLRAVPRAAVGDRVTLWGEGLPVEEIAAQASTIAYDLTCGMTKRVLFTEDER